MPPGEGLLYADIDLAQIVTRKTVQDFACHYNRPDLFKLMLDVRQQAQFRPAEDSLNEIANAGPLELQLPAPVAKRLNSASE